MRDALIAVGERAEAADSPETIQHQRAVRARPARFDSRRRVLQRTRAIVDELADGGHSPRPTRAPSTCRRLVVDTASAWVRIGATSPELSRWTNGGHLTRELDDRKRTTPLPVPRPGVSPPGVSRGVRIPDVRLHLRRRVSRCAGDLARLSKSYLFIVSLIQHLLYF